MINGRKRYKNLLAAASIAGFLALLLFFAGVGGLGANPATYINQLSNAFFSWCGSWDIGCPAGHPMSSEITSPAPPAMRGDRDGGDEILLNPSDFGLPANAKEIPEKRTAQSATFEIAPGKYAAVGVSDYLFAKDELGNWVIASDIGRQEGDWFVFDQLRGGVKASFDLNYPRYFLEKDGYWLMVGFSEPARAVIQNAREISYRLNDYATLTWRVRDNQIEKEIRVGKPGSPSSSAFVVNYSDNLTEELADNRLIYKNPDGQIIFSTKKLALTNVDGGVLDVPIKLERKGQWFYYSYPSDNLIYPYVIDPSAGPNSPASAAQQGAGTSWIVSPGDLQSLDVVNFASVTLGSGTTSNYLTATGFGFNIPSGVVINGIRVEWNKVRPDDPGLAYQDNAVRVIKGGVIGTTDKSVAGLWPTIATYVAHGGAIDLWGETWIAGDINATDFGVALKVICSVCYTPAPVIVDHVRITVYYDSGGPIIPAFNQSAYRFFNNLDSTDVGAPLALQDTAAVLNAAGDQFRLRQLIHVSGAAVGLSEGSFKLQYAVKSGVCDTGFVGETYADVTTGTVIAYNNNATPVDGSALMPNANDPVHGSDSVFNQTYEEGNNFTNSQSGITVGADGRWDFSLKDNGAPAGTGYCFRAVKADNSLLDTYSVIPEITTTAAAAAGITVNPTSGSTSSCPTSTTFTIVLNTQPTSDVQVSLGPTFLNRGVPSPFLVAFTTANWSTPVTITVTGGSEAGSYGISFSVSSTDANYNGLFVPNYSATNNFCLMTGFCQYNIANYGAGQKIISLSSAVSGVVKKVQIILTIVGSVITIDSWQNVP